MIKKINIEKLRKFLIKAKQNTYAGDGTRAESKCILSKNYIYIDGDYRYEDQYFGEYLDVGEEIVWYKEIPIWGMGYRGGMIKEYRDLSEKTFEFLRKALLKPQRDFSTRGPVEMKEENLIYRNIGNGDITSFTGYEFIECDGVKVYERHYIGGLIFGKNNVDMIITDL